MWFLHRRATSVCVNGRDSDRRLTRCRRAPIGLEALEGRALLSIPGVSLQFANLSITATKASGNVAQVSIDPLNHNVKVSLNGQTEEFSAKLVANVTYKGGSGGDDTFVNDTSLVELAYGYGGNNNFTGGTSYNYVFFYGNNNSYNAQDGDFTDVFEDGGTGDAINNPDGASIQCYS